MTVGEEVRCQIWTRSRDVLVRESPDGLLVLPRDRGEIISLVGPAAEIWSMLHRPVTVEALAERLGRRYAVEPATILDDIRAALASLLDLSAVRPEAQ
jgi:hypothetical protein